MKTKNEKRILCPRCKWAHDPKLLAGMGGTFVCVHCGEEFEVRK